MKYNDCYQLHGDVSQQNWSAEGGLIIDDKAGNVKTVWMSNAPQCILKVSGIQKYGIGFTKEVRIK